MKVLVFAARDAAGFKESRVLATSVSGQFVDRMSTALGDLRLVARYGIVEPICIVVLDGDEVVARIPRLVTEVELRGDLSACAKR
jgi:hypothetical protein